MGERYIQTSIGQLNIYPNEQLEPEFSVNMEGGIKQGFKIGSFTGYLDAVVFQQDFDRFVEFSFGRWISSLSPADYFGVGFRSVNTGGARITGYELEVAGKGKIGPMDITILAGWTHTTPVSTTPSEPYAYGVPTFGNANQ
ncbi:MAG: TonB-dependent receptor [Flavobacteriales bacterium]|nr:TonB-dependent receptor [Flavobacteriales bacterium]